MRQRLVIAIAITLTVGLTSKLEQLKATAAQEELLPFRLLRSFQFGGWDVAPDGSVILGGIHLNSFELLNPYTGKHRSISVGDSPLSLTISPDSKTFVTAKQIDQNVIKVWDIKSLKMRRSFIAHDVNNRNRGLTRFSDAGINGLDFSPNGKLLASCGVDGKINLWETARWTRQKSIRIEGDESQNVLVFSPNGKVLASLEGYDGQSSSTIRLWDTSTWKLNVSFQVPGRILCLKWSPDNKTIAIGGRMQAAKIIAAVDGQVIRTIEMKSWIHALAFSPDGQILITGGFHSDRFCRLWDTNTGGPLGVLAAYNWTVSMIKFTQDGKMLVTSDKMHTQIWVPQNKRPMSTALARK